MHGERARCIGDGCPYGVTDESEEEDIRVLLDHIHGFYKAALDRLPVESIPSLAPALLKAGMCFGVLDPVSNIIANTIAYSSAPPKISRRPEARPKEQQQQEEEEEEEEEDHGDDETRSSILCKIRADAFDKRIYDMFLSPKEMNGMAIARRSLQGLVGFLTFHFRYFSYTEAIHYLRLAGADLLIAVRLIKLDHCKSLDFNFTSQTAKVAFFCAAMSAGHPRPAVLLRAATLLGSRMVKVNNLLSGEHNIPPKSIKHLIKLLSQDAKSLKEKLTWLPMNLAESRYQDRQEKKRKRDAPTPAHTNRMQGTFAYTQSLKLLLLGKIHALYLEALALIPRDALSKRHHCNLIKGGYCYGPMDPVSNIILNTIWYGATFPMPQEFDFDFDSNMICTRLLDRVECCSLYGLVAFLRTSYPTLTETDALLYLLKSDADIGKSMVQIEQDDHALSGSYLDGLKEAAVHSWHPDPDALLSSVVHSTASSLMRASPLGYCRLEHLVTSRLPKSSPANSEEYVQKLSRASSSSAILNENQKMLIPAAKAKFKADQGFFVKKLNAVLNKLSQQKGVDYELHVICGVNTEVTARSSADLFKRNFQYEYFHMNFLATPKGSNDAGTAPELFFAECSNGDEDDEKRPSLCFPVKYSSIDEARCFCCEMNGIKIVHPYLEKYHGLYDFKKIASGEHGVLNDHIISSYDLHADRMCTIQEDWIYFDPKMDALIAEKNPIEDWARKIKKWGRVF